MSSVHAGHLGREIERDGVSLVVFGFVAAGPGGTHPTRRSDLVEGLSCAA